MNRSTHNIDAYELGLVVTDRNAFLKFLCTTVRINRPTYRQLGLPGTPRNDRSPHQGTRECKRRNVHTFRAMLKDGAWA